MAGPQPHRLLTGLLLTPLLLQGWSPTLATFWNTVGWTLSAEVLLYAAFSFILRLWFTRPLNLDTHRRLTILFLDFWIAGMVPTSSIYSSIPDYLAALISRYSYGLWLRALKYSPPAYLCRFLSGITLGKLQLQLHITPRRRFATAALGALLIAVFFYAAASRIPYIILHGGLLLPIFAIVTLGLSGPNALVTILAWRPLLAIGETTFCLYMLHFNTINLLHSWRIWERLHVATYDLWLSYATVLLLAALAHHLVERPAHTWILGRFTAQRSVAAASSR